ncbi:MAG: hypothetical protein Q8891_06750 [Bacteroidota bacterium]|nr:hypothetical protein [Bacteroidota bacterium]
MSIHIEIKDEHVKLMTDFYGGQLKAIREKKKELDKEEKEIENIISQLNSGNNEATPKEPLKLTTQKFYGGMPPYNPKWTILEKIKYVLNENHDTFGSGMTSREIIDRMLAIDPVLNADKVKAAKNVSTVLSIHNGKELKRDELSKDGRINVYSIK